MGDLEETQASLCKWQTRKGLVTLEIAGEDGG